MSKQMQTSRVEIPDPIPESSGRNLQGYGVGASSGTARRENSGQRTDKLMEAVVGRESMLGAYDRVMKNNGTSGIDEMSVEDLKPRLIWQKVNAGLWTWIWRNFSMKSTMIF